MIGRTNYRAKRSYSWRSLCIKPKLQTSFPVTSPIANVTGKSPTSLVSLVTDLLQTIVGRVANMLLGSYRLSNHLDMSRCLGLVVIVVPVVSCLANIIWQTTRNDTTVCYQYHKPVYKFKQLLKRFQINLHQVQKFLFMIICQIL